MRDKLSQVLKSNRSKKDMSLREFSNYLGISHTYLDKLEKGIGSREGNNIAPTVETLSKIADGLGIPLVDFMWQCGYFGSSSLKVSDNRLSENNEIDLKQLFNEVKVNLLSANKVTYNNAVINDVDLLVIIETLELGLEIMFRRAKQ